MRNESVEVYTRFGDGDGNDILKGGGGNDQLTGGVGADISEFGDNWGVDTLFDFTKDVDQLSLIDHSQVDELAELTIEQVGDNTIINDGTSELTLASIQSDTIDESDFLFI